MKCGNQPADMSLIPIVGKQPVCRVTNQVGYVDIALHFNFGQLPLDPPEFSSISVSGF